MNLIAGEDLKNGQAAVIGEDGKVYPLRPVKTPVLLAPVDIKKGDQIELDPVWRRLVSVTRKGSVVWKMTDQSRAHVGRWPTLRTLAESIGWVLWFATLVTWLMLPVYWLLWTYVYTEGFERAWLIGVAVTLPLVVLYLSWRKDRR